MKLFYSKLAKILVAIACIFFFICFCASVVAFSVLHSTSYREETGIVKDFDVHVYEDAGIAYAVLALSKHDSGFNSDLLNGMNCNYGIIEGKVDSDTDLNDNSIYLYRNFDGIAVPDKVGYKFFSEEYTVNSGTVFNHSDKFLRVVGEPNSIITDIGKHEEIYEVHGIGYDPLGKRAYVYANDRFIALDAFWYETDGIMYSASNLDENDGAVEITRDAYYAGNDGEAKNVDGSFSTIMADNKQDAKEDTEEGTEEGAEEAAEEGAAENDKLYIAGNEYDPISKTIEGYKLCLKDNNDSEGILSGDYVADLSPIHETLKEMDSFDSIGTRFTYFGDVPKIRTEVENPENKHYTFVCFPNEDKLSAKDHVNDYYAKANKIVAVTDAVNPFLLFLGIITFIMIWVCFVIFIKAVGHTRDSEEILDNPIANKPIDLLFVGTAVFEFMLLGISYDIARSVSQYMDLVALFVILVSMVTVGLIFCSSLAVNYKLHRLHRNYLVAKLFEKNKWSTKIWILYFAEAFFIFFMTMFLADIFGESVLLLSVFMDRVIIAALIMWGIRSYSKIKDSVEKLAAGDTTANVDVRGMPQFLEDTGTAINDIRNGIEIALEERTKSERMKVELITNVSHDIKTPITSIINYVDLLDKENLENEKVKEYLEVLNRQSLRLKKLVEDIIEASKISSGNIEFNMEEVDARVLLDQSIGEFSERLAEKKIEVVVNSFDDEIILKADNRYLWRVFDNIMSNIVKYAQADTRAYVDLEKEGDKLRFIFRNTSREQLNISPEELMERFVRGDKSRYTDGNGLGLSIARSLTEAMGGTMNILIDGDFFKVILEFDAITEIGE